MNEYIDKKLNLSKEILFNKWADEILAIFVIGSIIQEKTEYSDLDIAVVFSDGFFMKNTEVLLSDAQDIAQKINNDFCKYHLTIWPSKMWHYRTYLPDVSYVRANLFHTLSRLDAWCGLAKHTLLNYENNAHKNLYGKFEDIIKIYPIPRYESLELFLIATRILSEAIVKSLSVDPIINRNGEFLLAKAGLRAAYSVCISYNCKPCNSYFEIRNSAIDHFPENYHCLLNKFYSTKIALDKEKINLDEIITFFQYCERAISIVKRSEFRGIIAGLGGESFAYK